MVEEQEKQEEELQAGQAYIDSPMESSSSRDKGR